MAQPNWANRTLFHGDNLDFLRALNSESVHLIATDPPFNKGRDFHATPDSLASGASFQDRWSWKEDVHQEWIDQLEDDWPNVYHVIEGSRKSYGDDMGAFLCFMAVRLLEMHRILRKDGSMYLHCDPTASHYLKELMDAIFGKENFRNEVVWRRTMSKNFLTKDFGRNHDVIFRYTKSNNFIFNKDAVRKPYEEIPNGYRKGSDGRYFATAPVYASGARNGTSGQPAWFRGVKYTPRKDTHWRVAGGMKDGENVSEGWARLDKEGKMGISKNGKLPYSIRYLDEMLGIALDDVWADVPIPSRVESTGYPTQKPLTLYERFIKASTNKGDLVLDPFAGCATTCVAAEKLGRQWVGMDIWDGAYGVTIDRIKKEGYLAGPDGTRNDLIVTEGAITYSNKPPRRTDDAEYAVPYLKTIKDVHEPPGPKMTRAQMYKYLLEQHGHICQGCDRKFDDKRYLELDHNTPRSDGGLNHISNRILLCGPCNKLKSNRFTLSGLRNENRKLGYMYSGNTQQPESTVRQEHLSKFL